MLEEAGRSDLQPLRRVPGALVIRLAGSEGTRAPTVEEEAEGQARCSTRRVCFLLQGLVAEPGVQVPARPFAEAPLTVSERRAPERAVPGTEEEQTPSREEPPEEEQALPEMAPMRLHLEKAVTGARVTKTEVEVAVLVMQAEAEDSNRVPRVVAGLEEAEAPILSPGLAVRVP